MILEALNPWILLLTVLLILLLFIVVYAVRRADRRFEAKKIKETLSEEMQGVIAREREANRQKKEHFEALLREAGQPELKGPPGGC